MINFSKKNSLQRLIIVAVKTTLNSVAFIELVFLWMMFYATVDRRDWYEELDETLLFIITLIILTVLTSFSIFKSWTIHSKVKSLIYSILAPVVPYGIFVVVFLILWAYQIINSVV